MPNGQDVPFGDLRFKGSMRLPEVVSQLGTTFVGSRAEQSLNWRSNIAYTPQSSLAYAYETSR